MTNMTSTIARWTHAQRFAAGALLATMLAACGGGDFIESLVRLISARFAPATLSLPAGSTGAVQLEVSCDREGLDTDFGRLGVGVRLDPDATLPADVTATLDGSGPVDLFGFRYFDCVEATTDPEVKIARIPVRVSAAATVAPEASFTLVAFIEIERLLAGEPSKDSTTAELAITLTAPGAVGANLLVNPDFSVAVGTGTQPTAPGNWRGDVSSSVTAENGIEPRSAARMLKFEATGSVSSTNTVSGQQWQIVDVGGFAESIAAGGMRADAAVWFNRVLGGETTDRRFDLRLIAFAGPPSEMPARYAAGNWLAEQTTTVVSGGNQWQQALAGLTLPAGTTYLLFEIYAFEDVVNDGEGVEFAGHYADDASLVLTLE